MATGAFGGGGTAAVGSYDADACHRRCCGQMRAAASPRLTSRGRSIRAMRQTEAVRSLDVRSHETPAKGTKKRQRLSSGAAGIVRGRRPADQPTMRTRVRPPSDGSGASVIRVGSSHPIAVTARSWMSSPVAAVRPGPAHGWDRPAGRGPVVTARRHRRDVAINNKTLPRHGRQPGCARHVREHGLAPKLACFHA